MSVSASIQKRNLIAVRLNRHTKRASIIGPINTHYAFRGTKQPILLHFLLFRTF